MAVVVATMVVEPLVKIIMEKASNNLLDQYKVMKGMEKQRDILNRRLLAILDIITVAEQAASHKEGVKAWLEAIKKVAYQANKVFDEFKYEVLHREAKRNGQYKELGFDVVKLFATHNRFIFRNRMGRKLWKIVKAIEVLVTEMSTFHFERQQQPPVSNQWREMDHDIFDLKEITNRSRAKDNKNIVDILVGQANNPFLTVVPIVGMGGLGKTTLAQLVYNEPEIQKHFDFLVWVGVSDAFDVDSLAKSIIEAVPEKKVGRKATHSKTPLDSLQNVVTGQRYLLVLDDIWKQQVHIWEHLIARLQHGGRGSVVLTTTRDEGVAEILGTTEAYNLAALDDTFIKEIIETRAFSHLHKEEQRPAVLVNMVGEIVKRCVGSPLAATALGFVLRTKTSEEEWKAISSRSNIYIEESGILPVLKLSYNVLPSRMKQCFAFCAIFPKGYVIDVDKLIQLWIAHGFIVQENQVCLETVGKQIFRELASRSFFQNVKQVKGTVRETEHMGVCYSITTCQIHDLMHDVAMSVMEKECAFATEEPSMLKSVVVTEERSQSEWLPNTARKLFLSCEKPERKLNRSLKNSSATIQTLMCDIPLSSSLQHQSKYRSLQALQLRLHIPSFPLNPNHLHVLRYLDLSRSSIRAVPEGMSTLYNLQTLNLSGCRLLGGLPRQMKYMTALRHVYTQCCPALKSMPQDLRKLTSLQTLTCFVAGSGSDCSKVGELGHLNLGGQLELSSLENVTEKDAAAANLMEKKDIRELTLKWTRRLYYTLSNVNDARVLEKLKPHEGLYAIRIHSYGATTFPMTLARLPNIGEIHLFNCSRLKWLFNRHNDTSFAFPNLKELTLEDLDSLERWWDTDDDTMQGDEIMFPLLEKLYITGCGKLKKLPGRPTFPNLQKASLHRCQELTTTAKSPKLSALNMEGREGQLLLWVARHKTSLTNLELSNIEGGGTDEQHLMEKTMAEHTLREVLDGKEKWNYLDFPLAVLVLKYFNSDVIELCACFVHLQDLSIYWCYALVYWPEKEFEGLVSLRRLRIDRCSELIGYRQAPAESSTSSQTKQLLPGLESLTIWCCDSLVEVFSIPPSLRRMKISGCSKLKSNFGRRVQQAHSALSIHHGSSNILEVSSLPSPEAWVEHLEELKLDMCDGLTGVLHVSPSLKEIDIRRCDGLTSLESCSGELPLLELLKLRDCNTLSSLPDGPQAYSSLQRLTITECPGMKTLPTSLQQRLGSMQEEDIDAHHYGNTSRPIPTLLKPKTWKYAISRY
ncbi:putative disease resistance protein RGA4 isoform X1 [Lolium perenne]|uniref:putative disease resistance protein RGA4 isoform X1 n=1 Tax=Lolium perenne TaxID=4522 RepID=UPI0021F53365|nr:putative disease resistance protein RGA4 isoform X1 [Lolium perenne]